ncbi:MAG: DUF5329 domain-containing protein [Halioglobus sp.]
MSHRRGPQLLVSGLTLAIALTVATPLRADEASATEIGLLLDFVSTSGCDFIRNNSRHEPEEAADHLRLKYSRGKRYADTAEHFIDRLASKSSWSGKLYEVDCEDEPPQPAGPWLHRALADIRVQPDS